MLGWGGADVTHIFHWLLLHAGHLTNIVPLTPAKPYSEAFRHAGTAWWRHNGLERETHCAERKKFDITSAAVAGLSAPLSFYEMQRTEEHVGSV